MRDETTWISAVTGLVWTCLFSYMRDISIGINKVLAEFSGRELTFIALCWKTLKSSLQAIIRGGAATFILLCLSWPHLIRAGVLSAKLQLTWCYQVQTSWNWGPATPHSQERVFV